MSTSKLNIVARIQRWMDSVGGQTFMNYAYSWGASIVILGTLFKLTHLPGANLMLFIGMGTEVFVFFISAFDRPFDKTETELSDELVDAEAEEGETADEAVRGGVVIAGTGGAEGAVGGTVGGGTLIIGGGAGSAEDVAASATLVGAAEAANLQVEAGPALEEAMKLYTEKLNLLTETLDRVEQQAARLTTDSEEMANLNRTLTGINTVYELQLKSISTQVGSIDRINEQTRKMAEQIEELNGIYARMIKALTVNMKNAAGAQSA